jgi:hypothetical protein
VSASKDDLIGAVGGFITDSSVERGYRASISAARGNTQVILALELERQGGLCPKCDTPWSKIEVDNVFGKFSYFQPNCNCFRRCEHVPVFKALRNGTMRFAGTSPGCGRWLVTEGLLGIDHCTSCNPDGVHRETKKEPKGGSGDYKRDGKSAAAGEGRELDL